MSRSRQKKKESKVESFSQFLFPSLSFSSLRRRSFFSKIDTMFKSLPGLGLSSRSDGESCSSGASSSSGKMKT